MQNFWYKAVKSGEKIVFRGGLIRKNRKKKFSPPASPPPFRGFSYATDVRLVWFVFMAISPELGVVENKRRADSGS